MASKITFKQKFFKVRGSTKKQKFLVAFKGNKQIQRTSFKKLRQEFQTTKDAESRRKAISQFNKSGSLNPRILSTKTFSTGVKQTVSDFLPVGAKKDLTQTGIITIMKKGTKVAKYAGFGRVGVTGEEGKREAINDSINKAIRDGFITYKDVEKQRVRFTEGKLFYVTYNKPGRNPRGTRL